MSFKFPPRDIECRKVVPKQIGDVEKALKYVKSFNTCIQAGGNVGIWPQYLSEKFKYVYTFEPHPENFNYLCENVKNENVIKIQGALGEHPDMVSVDGDPKNCGAYQIEKDGFIPQFQLDDFTFNRVDFIQLDIEGMELPALMGAVQTIVTFSPVIMIEDKNLSEKYGFHKGDAGKFLAQRGYELKEEVHRDLIYVRT